MDVGGERTHQHPSSTQPAPRGTPALLTTGKGLLFPGRTEARAGGKIAHPRSPKGTGIGILPSSPKCCSAHKPLCHGRAWRALMHSQACLDTLGYTCSCEHTPVLSTPPCCAHSHAHVCAPQPRAQPPPVATIPRSAASVGTIPHPVPRLPLNHSANPLCCAVPPPPATMHTLEPVPVQRVSCCARGLCLRGSCVCKATCHGPCAPHPLPCPNCPWCEQGKRVQRRRHHFPQAKPTS